MNKPLQLSEKDFKQTGMKGRWRWLAQKDKVFAEINLDGKRFKADAQIESTDYKSYQEIQLLGRFVYTETKKAAIKMINSSLLDLYNAITVKEQVDE